MSIFLWVRASLNVHIKEHKGLTKFNENGRPLAWSFIKFLKSEYKIILTPYKGVKRNVNQRSVDLTATERIEDNDILCTIYQKERAMIQWSYSQGKVFKCQHNMKIFWKCKKFEMT